MEWKKGDRCKCGVVHRDYPKWENCKARNGQIHTEKRIVIGGKYAYVDRKIAELIKLMNELGLKTKNSCQGHPKYKEAYIEFDGFVLENYDKNTTMRWYIKENGNR